MEVRESYDKDRFNLSIKLKLWHKILQAGNYGSGTLPSDRLIALELVREGPINLDASFIDPP